MYSVARVDISEISDSGVYQKTKYPPILCLIHFVSLWSKQQFWNYYSLNCKIINEKVEICELYLHFPLDLNPK